MGRAHDLPREAQMTDHPDRLQPEDALPKRKAGRASKRDEIVAFLQRAGLDPLDFIEELGDIPAPGQASPETLDGPRPETLAEMSSAAMDLLWRRLPNFKETALTHATALLMKAAGEERAQPPPENQTVEVDVLDLIQTEGVLPERKQELLTAERVKLIGRLARIDEELENL